MSIALKTADAWTGIDYILDLEKALQSSLDDTREDSQEVEDLDQPSFSLTTGKYRHAKRYGADGM